MIAKAHQHINYYKIGNAGVPISLTFNPNNNAEGHTANYMSISP